MKNPKHHPSIAQKTAISTWQEDPLLSLLTADWERGTEMCTYHLFVYLTI